MQESDVEIHLRYDADCVYLSVEIPKEAGDAFDSEILWMVTEACAEIARLVKIEGH